MAADPPTLADVSLEFAHLYLADTSPERAVEQARREARFVEPLLERFRADGLGVSTTVLVDDTGSTGAADEPSAVDEATERILGASAAAGLEVDYVVRESVCASTLGQLLETFFPEEPPEGAGQLGTSDLVPVVDPVEQDARWLTNGEPGRFRAPLPVRKRARAQRDPDGESERPVRRTGSRGSRTHAIHLDVELWSRHRSAAPGPSTVWSCPMLAAWWQLLRLGAPERGTAGHHLAPQARTSRSQPFAAHATLTVLPPSFLGVEHAVRTILSRVVVPADWLPWRASREPDDLEHLDRMSYVFAGDLPDPRR